MGGKVTASGVLDVIHWVIVYGSLAVMFGMFIALSLDGIIGRGWRRGITGRVERFWRWLDE